MRRQSLIDYILYLVARFSSALLLALPVSVALGLGRFFGTLAYFINYKRAKVAYSNMRAAFCEEKEPSQIRRIVKDLYKNFGETLVEILRIPDVNKAYIEKYVRIENIHHIDNALTKGHGIIFLTGHFGNWELSSITSVLVGYPLLVLVREQKMTRLNDALNAYRESKGCKVVKKGMATREIYEHLQRNGIVGILSDQDAGKKGAFVNFFGRPTSTHRGAFTLSGKTGAVIIPTFMVRTNGAYHRLFLESPIEITADDESIEFEAMQKFASALEGYIRQYPEQWLWLHKRWKSTPLRKVVILSDGRRGHLNQSLAVFEKVKECRREYGYSDEATELKTIEVKYKTPIQKIALALLSRFIVEYPLLRMKSMKFCLTEESYKELKNCYADIVISCGSQTAAVNLLFARENNAKNIILMKPALISSGNFDLAIIPEHDKSPKNRNIVKTLGTPNLITPKKLEDDLKLLERMVNLDGKKNIGLFIGGESKSYTFNSSLMKEVLDSVIKAAKELDANILTTTSRRTRIDISDFVRRELGKTEFAKLVIVANERNPEWTVGGILAASDVVVVSGESSSMLSEATSSGKHVIVFRPKRKRNIFKNNKHELFLNRLDSSGIARVSEIKKLKEDIVELINSNKKPKKLDDNIKILEAVRKII
jgi:KDO2-lipid IV(A) lauroyltransferase